MQARKKPIIKRDDRARLSFRLPVDMLAAFNKQIKKSGFTASAYLRAMVIAHLQGKK